MVADRPIEIAVFAISKKKNKKNKTTKNAHTHNFIDFGHSYQISAFNIFKSYRRRVETIFFGSFKSGSFYFIHGIF